MDVKASIAGRAILCPICSSESYQTKVFLVAGKWLQTFDMEGFGDEGIMLICTKCSHIQHFARKSAVKIEEHMARTGKAAKKVTRKEV